MSVLKVGSSVNDYKIVKLLGTGQLGSTYLGQRTVYDPITGKPLVKSYAVKTLNLGKVKELGLDPAAVEAEAKVLKQMSGTPVCDRYISCYYDYFVQTIPGDNQQSQKFLITVTDYIKGPSLQQILLDQIQKGPFDKNKLMQMMAEIAQGVDFIHTHGVAHQNIKPSNIIYDEEHNRLRLVDFAFSCSQNLNAQCKGKAGTIYYMPPELIQLPIDPSQQEFAFRAAHDIWSMGVVFYQMANLGQDYMNFTSNDPEIIAKDIQIQNVKESHFDYVPVNSIIEAVLNKDYTKRPTAGQVIVLVRLGRPLCIVNDIPFDRVEAEAIVTALDLDIDPDIDDYSLCKKLTDYLNICKIRDNDYQKKHLIKLAKILGIKVTEDIESAVLCKMIQDGLKTHQAQYSEYVTQELIRAIEYMSWIQVRAGSEVKGELRDIQNNLAERYTFVYDEAKKLDLINLKMLEARRKEVTLRSLVYRQTASIAFATVYAMMAKNIVEVILDNNADAEVGGVPLRTFQEKVLAA